jgi:hypothetical protein
MLLVKLGENLGSVLKECGDDVKKNSEVIVGKYIERARLPRKEVEVNYQKYRHRT